MHKVSLRWPQEAARMVLVELISLLEGVAVSWYEWRWVGIEYWWVVEWVANDFALYVELLG
jgi:hypothetical protein